MQYMWLAALCVGIGFIAVALLDSAVWAWRDRHAEIKAREWAEKHGTRRSV